MQPKAERRGGSRGVMEVMILDDFMRLATLMKPSKEETNLSIFAISLKTIINKLGDDQKRNETSSPNFQNDKIDQRMHVERIEHAESYLIKESGLNETKINHKIRNHDPFGISMLMIYVIGITCAKLNERKP